MRFLIKRTSQTLDLISATIPQRHTHTYSLQHTPNHYHSQLTPKYSVNIDTI